jgi:Uma2 family endonuclease
MLMPLRITETKRLYATSAGLRMSLEEFREIDDFEEGFRFELIKGVLVVTPPPSPAHSNSDDELGYLLRSYREQHPQGKCIDGTFGDVEIVTSTGLRVADRAIWVGLGRLPQPARDIPSVIVEFVSPGKAAYVRDYEQKRDEYLELGVREYWVLDRFDHTLSVFRPGMPWLIVKVDEVYTTDLLPGFNLAVKRIMTAADEYRS